ncbi:hypothetical protein D3C79_929230 [compost metagenome]
MAWPRVAVDAAMLATAIGIDRSIEGQVRRRIAGNDGFRRFNAHLGTLGERYFLIPAVVLNHRMAGGKAVVRVGCGAAAAGRQRADHRRTP